MKLKEILFFVFLTAPLCLFLLLPNFLSAQTISISEIEIVGNQRIEVDTIKSYISLSPGNVFEGDEINAAYQRVLKSGLFESCLLYTSPSPRDKRQSRMPSSA